MITPFKYRLGIELAQDAIRTVLLEVSHSSCMLLRADEFDISVPETVRSGDFGSALQSISQVVPSSDGLIPASVVLPAEYVIEFTIQIPKGLTIRRDEWERWEIATHLIGRHEDYLYESIHLMDSICGKYQIRRVRAARKRNVNHLTDQAKSIGLLIDQMFFPQSVWGDVVSSYCAREDAEAAECVFIGSKCAYLVRTSQRHVTDLLPAHLPTDGKMERFAETIETLLSWHTSGSRARIDRVVINGADEDELASELSSRLNFRGFNPDHISKILHGTIDKPERFLLPLAALGVI
ncbi:MAG: hypothetical protein KKG33_13475 [candidate division Zixibacteria bacterium]|nr:hypothetical protein [candidate division Zixibacteria bacterium]MBU1469198.1 hypothetical protein [candidate division Zixibacteria bacterium]MBU2626564.1 hypothetical protein [candidate division Zixibacteria bacterium]